MPTFNMIETYVFLDVETTGLPSTNYGETKITEISLLSVLRRHFDESPANEVPRVLDKLTMCFHPAKFISSAAQKNSGLSNELLEQKGTFNKNFCNILHNFLLRQPQPICILAHNGNDFDFPLLQAHTKFLGMPLPEGILCADTLLAFRELKVVEHNDHWISKLEPWDDNFTFDALKVLDEVEQSGTRHPEFPDSAPWDETFTTDLHKVLGELESVHEKYGHLETQDAMNNIYSQTPKKSSVSEPKNLSRLKSHKSHTSERARRRLDFDSEPPKIFKPYSLGEVYQNFFGECIINAHSAEADSMALLRCITAIGAPFHIWVQKNHQKLNSILKMW